MCKRQHIDLSIAFENHFPKLFNFERCGILFVCAKTGNLQKIQPAPTSEDQPD